MVEPTRIDPRGILRDGAVAAATALVILALALLPLLTPWVMHPALDAAQAEVWLGTDRATAHALSDRTVEELLVGPGTFVIVGPDGAPFYDPSEVRHLDDVRSLLWLLLLAAGLALLGIVTLLARASRPGVVIRAIGIGGGLTAIVVGVVGIVGVVAFDPLFELFHQVFFPQGDWAFDPSTQRIVQLYPFAFWELMAAALGATMVILGTLTWLVARRLGGRGAATGSSR